MRATLLTPLACIALLAAGPIHAQATDMAAERARVANQRIQAEAERQAREEEERLRQAESQAGAAQHASAAVQTTQPPPQPVTAQESRAAPTPAPMNEIRPADRQAPDTDMARVLEQLRQLGELKDAGYVTDEEFDRIKQRILDQSL